MRENEHTKEQIILFRQKPFGGGDRLQLKNNKPAITDDGKG